MNIAADSGVQMNLSSATEGKVIDSEGVGGEEQRRPNSAVTGKWNRFCWVEMRDKEGVLGF